MNISVPCRLTSLLDVVVMARVSKAGPDRLVEVGERPVVIALTVVSDAAAGVVERHLSD
jgi:hypothetical protein